MNFLHKAVIITLVLGTVTEGYCPPRKREKRGRDNIEEAARCPQELSLDFVTMLDKKIETACETLHNLLVEETKTSGDVVDDDLMSAFDHLSLDGKNDFASSNRELINTLYVDIRTMDEYLKNYKTQLDEDLVATLSWNLKFAQGFLKIMKL